MSRPLIEISKNSIMDQEQQQPVDSTERVTSINDGNDEPIASLRSVRAQAVVSMPSIKSVARISAAIVSAFA